MVVKPREKGGARMTIRLLTFFLKKERKRKRKEGE